jgi:ketosteroid isomerase-like protein
MSPTEMETLAREFFDAVERGDIDKVFATYAADAVIWHNTDAATQTAEENVAGLRGFVQRIPERRYTERRVNVFPGGFVQQHVLKGVRKDGVAVELPCCIVCQVRDGKISRLDEYFDSEHVAQFRKVVA